MHSSEHGHGSGHHHHHGHSHASGHHHSHAPALVSAEAGAGAAAPAPARVASIMRSEIQEPTFDQVSAILMRVGSCMVSITGLDFTNEKMVTAAWDMIMDAAIPHDGRRQQIVEVTSGMYWLLRNLPSAMPMHADMQNYPDYGQFSDTDLRTLNNWGKLQKLTDYSDAVATCRPVPWGSLLPPSPDEPSGTKNKLVRHDVSAVYADSKLRSQICDAFRVLADPDKFQRLKGATDTKYGMANLGQWGDLAAIHGGPWQTYSNASSGLGMWCWHEAWQFIPWHRPWLAAVEAALAAAQKYCGYDTPIGLPYWDQTLPYKVDGKDSWRNGHPMFFEKEYFSVRENKKLPNPLHPANARSLFKVDGSPQDAGKSRRIIRGWTEKMLATSVSYPPQRSDVEKYYGITPGGRTWDQVLDEWDDEAHSFDFSQIKYPKGGKDSLVAWMRRYLSMAPSQKTYYEKKVTDETPVGAAQWIEAVHNQIHNWIGLDCQDAAIAGFDPILYFFHSNIDRQFQTIIDAHGADIFSWLSTTPTGAPDHANDLTALHMPVPFPKELHDLVKQRLGRDKLPSYKNSFQLDWFNYTYDTPYIFPTLAEAGVNPDRASWVVLPVERVPMDTSLVVVELKGQVVGSIHTLGMSMNSHMRQIHTPTMIAPILFEDEPQARLPRGEMTAKIVTGRLSIKEAPKLPVVGGSFRPSQ